MWFSPNSERLAYVQFNDSQVREVRLPLYDSDPSRSPYVRHGAVRYPKAGAANPTVSLRVVDLRDRANEKTSKIEPPPIMAKG